MKIAKYIFLLVLLFVITSSILIITKDGSYTVVKSKLIKVPKNTVFNYLAENKNWDVINPWKNTLEKGSLIKQEEFNKDSIAQIISLNNTNEIKTTWQFTDSLNYTKISWITKGKMSFKEKFLGIINRGQKNNLADSFEIGLSNLNKILTTEINTFNIKIDGFVNRDTIFYIQKPATCKLEQLPNNIKIILPKLQKLLLVTKRKTNGEPFIIYHSKDTVANTITFSVAIPTKEKVQISAGSDIYSGQNNPFQAVKATLTGNYNHKKEAVAKIFAYMKENKLEQSPKYKEVDIILKNTTTDKSASKWVTEILIPVRPIKPIVKKKPKVIVDSTAVEEEPIME
ncbi:GyrI-like domain-containing protein [Flavobacterium sp.]|uniref:GyrI-like domain-containing protein n=1 Tax=Flavobacterium sp. TaxID=239 RepID=UPI00286CFA7A|nr:GyrI-like domain-containing protein [Flavobacterium sp.]